MSGKHFKDMLDVTTALEAKMDKQVLETKALSEALNQKDIAMTIIRDNDAVQTYKALHLAQSLQHQVEDSAEAIKCLEIQTNTLNIQHSTVMTSLVELERFTGMQSHLQMLHLIDRQQSKGPPERALPSTPKQRKEKKKYPHKWLFGAQDPFALETLDLPQNL